MKVDWNKVANVMEAIGFLALGGLTATVPISAVLYWFAPSCVGWSIHAALGLLALFCAAVIANEKANMANRKLNPIQHGPTDEEQLIEPPPPADPNHVMQSNAEYYDAITESRS